MVGIKSSNLYWEVRANVLGETETFGQPKPLKLGEISEMSNAVLNG
jgi:hypothetical protein